MQGSATHVVVDLLKGPNIFEVQINIIQRQVVFKNMFPVVFTGNIFI